MATIQATIFFEKRFWVGTFERTDKQSYAVAKHIFGDEPTDPEIYDFILKNYRELQFGDAKHIEVQIRRMNPKRVQREVRKEMKKLKETSLPSTLAQEFMREEIEKRNKVKKQVTGAEKQARKEAQFVLRQEKKKSKHRGH